MHQALFNYKLDKVARLVADPPLDAVTPLGKIHPFTTYILVTFEPIMQFWIKDVLMN